ncbi:hypothetical protein KW799_02125 [Candidatus Parcubacteria bacterium]|nr:hypothetical protein [Candidatus Parcubacteria bacterium]
MKTLFVRFFFVLALLFSTARATTPVVNANVTDSVQNTERDLQKPIPLEMISGIHGPGRVDSIWVAVYWQLKHRDSEIVALTPVIENDALKGWRIDYRPAKKPGLILGDYLEAGVPYIVPEGASLDEVLKETWDTASKELTKFNRRNLRMLVPNVKHVDGKTIVYGLWYTYSDSDMHIVPKPNKPGEYAFRNDSNSSSSGSNPYRESQKRLEKSNSISLPLPQIVMNRPELQLPRQMIVAEGETVTMKPFKVTAQWFDLQLIDAKGRQVVADNDKIAVVKVDSVTAGSPIDEAGVKAGMLVKSMHGIDFAGLTKEEFNTRVMSAPFKGDLHIEVIDKPGAEPREVVISMAKLPRPSTKVADASP